MMLVAEIPMSVQHIQKIVYASEYNNQVEEICFEQCGDHWHVYLWVDGYCFNWNVTVGRHFKTEDDARQFVRNNGWEFVI